MHLQKDIMNILDKTGFNCIEPTSEKGKYNIFIQNIILIGEILDSVHSVAGFQIEFIYGPQDFKWHGNNFLKILISDFTF